MGIELHKRELSMITYDLKEFSDTPYGRYDDDGRYNGGKFRELLAKKLKEVMTQNEQLEIDLSHIKMGIGSSFLEESFGGLVRKGFFTKDQLLSGKDRLLFIKSDLEFYIEEIEGYIAKAKPE
jgi:hypothetical protein